MAKCRICGKESLKNHVEQYHKILTEYNKTTSYEAKSRAELNKEIKKLAAFINVASFENPMNLGPDKERLEGLKNELASLGEGLVVHDEDSQYMGTVRGHDGIFDNLEDAKKVADSMSGYVTTEEDADNPWPEEVAVYISPTYKTFEFGESKASEGRGDTYGRRQENLWPEHTDETQCVTCGLGIDSHANPNTDYRGMNGDAPATDHYYLGGDLGGSDDKLYFESRANENLEDIEVSSADWYIEGSDIHCRHCDQTYYVGESPRDDIGNTENMAMQHTHEHEADESIASEDVYISDQEEDYLDIGIDRWTGKRKRGVGEGDPDYEGDQKTIKALLKKNGSVTFEDFLGQSGDYPQDLGESRANEDDDDLDKEYCGICKSNQEFLTDDDEDRFCSKCGYYDQDSLHESRRAREYSYDEIKADLDSQTEEERRITKEIFDTLGYDSLDQDGKTSLDILRKEFGGESRVSEGNISKFGFTDDAGLHKHEWHSEDGVKLCGFLPNLDDKIDESHEYTCTECGDKFGERDEYVDHQNTHKEES